MGAVVGWLLLPIIFLRWCYYEYKKVKKVFKAAFLCVLISILVGSALAPTDSSAASLTDQIENITRFVTEPYDVMWDVINFNMSLGNPLERKMSGDVLMTDYTADNPSVISSPLYFVRGRVVQHYFNIDNSDDVDNIDIDEFFCCTVTNINPLTVMPIQMLEIIFRLIFQISLGMITVLALYIFAVSSMMIL